MRNKGGYSYVDYIKVIVGSDIMKCPICTKKGFKSYVYVGGSMSTLMYAQPYYDEEGNFHCDDPNTTTTSYSCSKGHKWRVASCRGKEIITIGGGEMNVDQRRKI